MAIVLSILVLATIAMVLGALALWRRGGARKQVTLMLVLAAVMAANVALLTVPGADGQAPASHPLP